MNDAVKCKILNLIRLKWPISRTEISEKLNISMTAVTNFVSELISEGLVIETGTGQSTGGRKPIALKIDKDYGRTIAIDFGQKFFRIAVCDLDDNILHMEELDSKALGTSQTGISKLFSIIERTLGNAAMGNGKLLGIGVGISGIVDFNKGTCITIPNIEGWNDVPVRQLLEERFGVPVSVDDTSRLQALAESCKDRVYKKNLIFLNIGIGLGAGIIIDWKLFRGADGLAGELGHIIVEENGCQCGCGNKGCLEQYVSVPSIIRRIRAMLSMGVKSILQEYTGNDPEQLTPELVAKASREDDKLLYNVLIETGQYLGKGLAHLVTLFNPEFIVIGGGGAFISDEMLQESIRVMRMRAVSRSSRNIGIARSTLGKTGVLTGASRMVVDKYLKLYDLLDDNLYKAIQS